MCHKLMPCSFCVSKCWVTVVLAQNVTTTVPQADVQTEWRNSTSTLSLSPPFIHVHGGATQCFIGKFPFVWNIKSITKPMRKMDIVSPSLCVSWIKAWAWNAFDFRIRTHFQSINQTNQFISVNPTAIILCALTKNSFRFDFHFNYNFSIVNE